MAKTRNTLSGFTEFVREQGVVGLAIGVIIGVAAKDAVDVLVNNIFNPLVSMLLPVDTLTSATVTINDTVFGWGAVVSALINLIVVAAVIYFGIKSLNLEKLDKKKD